MWRVPPLCDTIVQLIFFPLFQQTRHDSTQWPDSQNALFLNSIPSVTVVLLHLGQRFKKALCRRKVSSVLPHIIECHCITHLLYTRVSFSPLIWGMFPVQRWTVTCWLTTIVRYIVGETNKLITAVSRSLVTWSHLHWLGFLCGTIKKMALVVDMLKYQPRLIGNMCLWQHFCKTDITHLITRFTTVSKWIVQWVALKQWFSNLFLGTHCSAHFACLPNLHTWFRSSAH